MTKKTHRLILYILLIIISSSIVLSLVLKNSYGEKMKEAVLNRVQENIEVKVNLSDIDFTIWKHFPFGTVTLNNLLILNKNNEDTLLYSKNTYINFSLSDIVLKKDIVTHIALNEAIININYDAENQANYQIFKPIKQKQKTIIDEIILENTKISYIKKKTNINWEILQALIELKKDNNINITSQAYSNKIKIGKINYANNKNCTVKLFLEKKTDTLHIYKNSQILIEEVLMQLNGSIKKDWIDINVSAEKQQIKHLIRHMPNRFKESTAAFISKGLITFQAIIKGVIQKRNNPYFSMDFKIEDGYMEFKKTPFILQKINTNGKINNGEYKNFNSSFLEFIDFNANTKKGNIKGTFNISNFNKYFLNAKLNSNWDLEEINRYFEKSPFINIKGNLSASTNYQGNLSFNKKFKNYFLDANHISKINLKNVFFNHTGLEDKWQILNLNSIINHKDISINNSQISFAENRFNYSGEIDNIIPYLLQKSDMINISGNISSNKISFQERETKQKEATLPKWVSINTKIHINNFNYKNTYIQNLNGQLTYNKKSLRGIDFKGNILDGAMNLDFTLTEPTKNYLLLKTDIKLKKINIRKTFEAFQNFDQKFISKDEINGIATSEINIESHWKPSFVFNPEKLKIKSHLVIEKGELINFKPLEKLSTFVSLDDLKHVKFSTLENTIEVANKIVSIPTMEIKSTALSLFLSGTHTFEQELDYNITLLLSELLSKKFRKENTNINNQFGEIIKEEENFTTVYLKMQGNKDGVKTTFDGLRIKEGFKKNISNEIKNINTIIKEDILKKNKNKEEANEQDIRIEWEEEENYLPQ